MKFDFDTDFSDTATIKVVGVGGAGGNAVSRMIDAGLTGVDFVSINTDAQVLAESQALHRIQIGRKLTKGLGSGGDPEMGRQAIEEDVDGVAEVLRGADMVFVTAGMGGGTGTGASPVVARLARQAGALTVGVVTKPFLFEGRQRMRAAEAGLEELRAEVDTLITIPNQRLFEVVDLDLPFTEAFRIADDVLLQATRGISDLITVTGLINLDFADVKNIMAGMGPALMGSGRASGESRAEAAARQAISCPLLQDQDIAGARGVLINLTGNASMTLREVTRATEIITEAVGEEANIIFGAVLDARESDELSVTVIATGFGAGRAEYVFGRDDAAEPAATGVAAAEAALAAAAGAAGGELRVIEIRPEPRPEAEAAPAATRLAEEADAMRAEVLPDISPGERNADDWDVPTFLRRQSD
ncbi:MAG: cell division protein FtsZ [Candidatus Krumholzibacteriota bacterium]|nr:cell division protein FtsZ [Candidatus Krumholzibacteriota bacterium]